jgi:hypothetical protein
MVKAGEIEYATLAYLAGEKIAAKYLTLNQASETVYDVLNGGRVVDHIVKDGNGWKDSKGHSGASPLEVLDQLTYVAKRNGTMDYKAVAYLAGEEEQPDKEKNRVWRLENLEPEPEDKNASTAYLAGEETEASIESEALFGFPTFDPQGAADDYEKWKYFHDHEHDKRPPLGLKDYGPPSGPGMTDKEKTDFKRDWDRSKKSIKILAFGAPSGDQGFLNSVADKLVSVYHEDPEAEYIQLLRKGRGDKKFLDWVAYRFIQHHGVKADVELVNSLQNHAG